MWVTHGLGYILELSLSPLGTTLGYKLNAAGPLKSFGNTEHPQPILTPGYCCIVPNQPPKRTSGTLSPKLAASLHPQAPQISYSLHPCTHGSPHVPSWLHPSSLGTGKLRPGMARALRGSVLTLGASTPLKCQSQRLVHSLQPPWAVLEPSLLHLKRPVVSRRVRKGR